MPTFFHSSRLVLVPVSLGTRIQNETLFPSEVSKGIVNAIVSGGERVELYADVLREGIGPSGVRSELKEALTWLAKSNTDGNHQIYAFRALLFVQQQLEAPSRAINNIIRIAARGIMDTHYLSDDIKREAKSWLQNNNYSVAPSPVRPLPAKLR